MRYSGYVGIFKHFKMTTVLNDRTCRQKRLFSNSICTPGIKKWSIVPAQIIPFVLSDAAETALKSS